MKNFIITLMLSLFSIVTVFGQMKYDYHWFFGYDFDGAIPGVEGVHLRFNESPLNITLEEIPFWIYQSNATMSDENGELLFYTNGCSIANKNHEIMMNGDSLNPGFFHESQCDFGYSGANQSCLVLPKPNSINQFYLFHKGVDYSPSLSLYCNTLYYSLIDMSLDNSLGAVLEKNVLIREDTIQAGEMTAIKHSNGTDWWIINSTHQTNEYFTILLTEGSIEGPFFQNIGLANSDIGEASGQVIFSPDGTKFARYSKIEHLYLYDFDRTSGLLSNFEHIIVDDTIASGGCAFSSNSRFLYVSTRLKLFQFDLEAANVADSKVLVGEYDGTNGLFPPTFSQMQLAPDCRIFMNSTTTVDELHIIHSPNEKGLACNFEQRALQLPSNHRKSMPHFPYYRMDTDYPICDSSLVVSSTQVHQKLKPEIKIYPNPATDKVTIDLGHLLTKRREIKLYDMIGQIVKTANLGEGTSKIDISTQDIPTGIYFIKIEGQKTMLLNVVK